MYIYSEQAACPYRRPTDRRGTAACPYRRPPAPRQRKRCRERRPPLYAGAEPLSSGSSGAGKGAALLEHAGAGAHQPGLLARLECFGGEAEDGLREIANK